MPMVAIVVLAGNVADSQLRSDFILTVAGGLISGGLISYLVGRSLRRWLRDHQQASERIARGDLTTRVGEKRPDEWGKLTDRFNDMAEGLEQAEKEHETFGQIVHPKIRDALLQRYQGLGGEVQQVTVMFVDIRGFTRRSAGEPPEKVVALLNRFLSLAVAVIEDREMGFVNKFLGDGLMALFGSLDPGPHDADNAVAAAVELLRRLQLLNKDLEHQGQDPLRIGVGIHTGAALVGCVGASVLLADGQTALRREITAIGETINLGSRIEQLTKTCGGPILLSDSTRRHLTRPVPLQPLGPQPVPGYEGTLEIYAVRAEEHS
jgi:adenylate cyclase